MPRILLLLQEAGTDQAELCLRAAEERLLAKVC
jgi:hypothetical protein